MTVLGLADPTLTALAQAARDAAINDALARVQKDRISVERNVYGPNVPAYVSGMQRAEAILSECLSRPLEVSAATILNGGK